MTATEKTTINRGCIGVTAQNLDGAGDPPLDLCYGSFADARTKMKQMNAVLDWMAAVAFFGPTLAGNARYVVFAKLFWSNQHPDPAIRKKSAKKAYRAIRRPAAST